MIDPLVGTLGGQTNGKKKLVNNTKLFNGNYMTGYTTKYIDSVNPYFFIDTKEE